MCGTSPRRLTERSTTAAFPFALLILTTCGLPPRSVARIGQTALAGRLALRGVGDGMVMVSIGRLIRPPPSRLDGRLRRLARDEAVTARADQVLSPRLEQSLAD